MTNISLSSRKMLKDNFNINAVKVDDIQISMVAPLKTPFVCSTTKFVRGFNPADTRMTACISSQVGGLACEFCATGRLKRMRNINADEIYDQVRIIRDQALGQWATLIEYCLYGISEPLLNYKNVLASIEKITSEEGLGMSPNELPFLQPELLE